MYIVCFIPDILPFLPYYAVIILQQFTAMDLQSKCNSSSTTKLK